jgi:hypothetical protein
MLLLTGTYIKNDDETPSSVVGTNSGNPTRRREPLNFCTYCSFESVYVDYFHARYYNMCGTVEIIGPYKLKAQLEHEKEAR